MRIPNLGKWVPIVCVCVFQNISTHFLELKLFKKYLTVEEKRGEELREANACFGTKTDQQTSAK